MHYDLKNIAGNNQAMLNTLPKSQSHTLSYTDKYYIAMLYNQNISDKTLEQMHKQDIWKQLKFEKNELYEVSLTSMLHIAHNRHIKATDIFERVGILFEIVSIMGIGLNHKLSSKRAGEFLKLLSHKGELTLDNSDKKTTSALRSMGW